MKRLIFFSVCLMTTFILRAQTDKSWMTLPDMEANQLRAQLLYKTQLYEANIDVRHARLELDIDPNSDSISGCSRLTIEWVSSPFNRFFLDFTRAGMHIDSVTDANGNHLSFIHNARHLVDIQRASLAEKGLLEEVRVYFSGKPEQPGRRSFTYQLHGRPGDVHRVAATLSQPYGARDWWPCRDNLYDKIDSIDMVVSVPPGMLAAGLGSLEKVSKGTERDTFHWKHRYPVVSYLVAVGVTNYSEYTDWYVNRNGDSLAVLNYVFPVVDSLARTQTPIILEMMRVFEDLFGPYPFYDEKYGHAQFVFSGGMEHQTMSFMGNFNFDLQAHELAHQWFGNMVTCGSWQDIWLNEGFATYLTMLCHEHIRGDSAFMAGMNAMRTRVMRESGGSVYIPAEDTLNVSRVFNGRLSYEKGAWVLHMLRFVLGDDNFYAGLNTYLYDNANQHAFVSTKNLQDHLEAASGKDLNLFFNEWVYGQGFPEFVLRWRSDNNQLDISLTQNTSIPAWNYFSIPVPVLVQGIERDTLLLLEHQGEQERFNFSLPFRPQSIVVDPFVQVLARFDAIKEQSDEEKYRLAVFPIPAQHELMISSDSQIVRRINIYDISGKLLHNQAFEPSGSTRLSIDIRELNSGVYLLELITDNEQKVVRKVVKE